MTIEIVEMSWRLEVRDYWEVHTPDTEPEREALWEKLDLMSDYNSEKLAEACVNYQGDARHFVLMRGLGIICGEEDEESHFEKVLAVPAGVIPIAAYENCRRVFNQEDPLLAFHNSLHAFEAWPMEEGLGI